MFPSVKRLILEHNNFTVRCTWPGRSFNAVTSTYVQKAERGLLTPFPLVEEVLLGHNKISFIGYDSLRMPQIKIIRLNDNRIQVSHLRLAPSRRPDNSVISGIGNACLPLYPSTARGRSEWEQDRTIYGVLPESFKSSRTSQIVERSLTCNSYIGY